jgi:hypothetical protein
MLAKAELTGLQIIHSYDKTLGSINQCDVASISKTVSYCQHTNSSLVGLREGTIAHTKAAESHFVPILHSSGMSLTELLHVL